MPASFARASQERVEIQIEINGETLTLGVNARGFTPEFVAAVPQPDDDASPLENINSMIAQIKGLILDWDFMEGEGAKARAVPIDDPHLRRLPLSLLQEILTKLMEIVAPNLTGNTVN